MSRLPDAADLLAAAHEALSKKVLPALSGSVRYDALMISNALRIAMREIGTNSVDAAVDWSKEREFAAAIRHGEHDDDTAALRELRRSTTAKLRISNPKALLSSFGSK